MLWPLNLALAVVLHNIMVTRRTASTGVFFCYMVALRKAIFMWDPTYSFFPPFSSSSSSPLFTFCFMSAGLSEVGRQWTNLQLCIWHSGKAQQRLWGRRLPFSCFVSGECSCTLPTAILVPAKFWEVCRLLSALLLLLSSPLCFFSLHLLADYIHIYSAIDVLDNFCHRALKLWRLHTLTIAFLSVS